MGLKIGKYEVSALCYRSYRLYMRTKMAFVGDKVKRSEIERRLEEAFVSLKQYGLTDLQAMLCAEDKVDAEDYNNEKMGELK